MYVGTPSVRDVYLLIAVASATAALVWMISWRKRTAFTLKGPLHTLRDTWAFGMWVPAGNLAFVLSQQIYPWYLTWLKAPEAAGAFAACVGLLALINPFVSAVGNYLGPITAKATLRGQQELLRVIRQASILLVVVVGIFFFGIIVNGNRLLLFLYGSAYRVDAGIFVVLGASVLASTSTLAVSFGFWAIGRPDINLKINCRPLPPLLHMASGRIWRTRSSVWVIGSQRICISIEAYRSKPSASPFINKNRGNATLTWRSDHILHRRLFHGYLLYSYSRYLP